MILQLVLILPALTVITAVPLRLAVTLPLDVTVTTFLLDEVKVTLSNDVIGSSCGTNVYDFLLRRVSLLCIP